MLEGLTEGGTEVELEGCHGFGKPGELRGGEALLAGGLEEAAESVKGLEGVRLFVFRAVNSLCNQSRDIFKKAG